MPRFFNAFPSICFQNQKVVVIFGKYAYFLRDYDEENIREALTCYDQKRQVFYIDIYKKSIYNIDSAKRSKILLTFLNFEHFIGFQSKVELRVAKSFGGYIVHKHIRKNNQKTKVKNKIGPTRLAGRLWLTGMIILTLGVCDVAARLYDGLRAGAIGLMLNLGYDIECLMAGAAILTGGALLLDYMERKQAMEDDR